MSNNIIQSIKNGDTNLVIPTQEITQKSVMELVESTFQGANKHLREKVIEYEKNLVTENLSDIASIGSEPAKLTTTTTKNVAHSAVLVGKANKDNIVFFKHLDKEIGSINPNNFIEKKPLNIFGFEVKFIKTDQPKIDVQFKELDDMKKVLSQRVEANQNLHNSLSVYTDLISRQQEMYFISILTILLRIAKLKNDKNIKGNIIEYLKNQIIDLGYKYQSTKVQSALIEALISSVGNDLQESKIAAELGIFSLQDNIAALMVAAASGSSKEMSSQLMSTAKKIRRKTIELTGQAIDKQYQNENRKVLEIQDMSVDLNKIKDILEKKITRRVEMNRKVATMIVNITKGFGEDQLSSVKQELEEAQKAFSLPLQSSKTSAKNAEVEKQLLV